MTPARRAPGLAQASSATALAAAATSSERSDSRPAAAKPVHASDVVDEPSGRRRRLRQPAPTALARMAPMGAGIDATRRRSQANVDRGTPYGLCGSGRHHPGADCECRQYHGRHRADG